MKPVLPGIAGQPSAFHARSDKVIDLTNLLPSPMAADQAAFAAQSNAVVLPFPKVTGDGACETKGPRQSRRSIWDRLHDVLNHFEDRSRDRRARRVEAAIRRATAKVDAPKMPIRPGPFGV